MLWVVRFGKAQQGRGIRLTGQELWEDIGS